MGCESLSVFKVGLHLSHVNHSGLRHTSGERVGILGPSILPSGRVTSFPIGDVFSGLLTERIIFIIL